LNSHAEGCTIFIDDMRKVSLREPFSLLKIELKVLMAIFHVKRKEEVAN
jgi:hypothetical protein